MNKTCVPDVTRLDYKGPAGRPDIKIFVAQRVDMESETIDCPLFIPVRCGAVFDDRSPEKIREMPGDDTGDNISERRMTFNEFTVLYWAWKNVNADYYGLCHYRRYMIFPAQGLQADPYGNVLIDNLNYDSCISCGLLNLHKMEKIIKANDILLSIPYDVTYRGFHNLFEHYTEVPMQHRADLNTALEVLCELYPNYAESANEYLNGTLFYPCNLFIMKREIFKEYCQWIFKILFKLEDRISIKNYTEQEQRVYGLIGERLLGVFVTQYLKDHPDAKFSVVQRALFLNTTRTNECKQTLQNKLKHFLKNHMNESGSAYQLVKKLYQLTKK